MTHIKLGRLKSFVCGFVQGRRSLRVYFFVGVSKEKTGKRTEQRKVIKVDDDTYTVSCYDGS